MTDEEQRIAMAEACGWWKELRDEMSLSDRALFHDKNEVWFDLNGRPGTPLDYLNDWNAVHDAVNSLTAEQRGNFIANLAKVLDEDSPNDPLWLPGKMVACTKRQWCKAFLRTVGKWKEGKP